MTCFGYARLGSLTFLAAVASFLAASSKRGSNGNDSRNSNSNTANSKKARTKSKNQQQQ